MTDIKATGEVTIEKLDGITGEVTTTVVKNLIVTLGKQYIAGRLLQTPQAAMTSMAIGTGVTAAVIGNTQLEAEVLATAYASGTVRPTLDGAYNPARTLAVLTYKCTFGPATAVSSNAITEAGIFDSTTRGAGTMMARTLFGAVTKTNADTVTLSWAVTIG